MSVRKRKWRDAKGRVIAAKAEATGAAVSDDAIKRAVLDSIRAHHDRSAPTASGGHLA
ncbi:MAG: hypothetical protein HC834_05600, partial [Rhodospirillales bacterium]|nr:hypothetical protein [Rhodospirillales bacterium]